MYTLAIDTPNSQPHPLFKYETLDEALTKTEKSIFSEYLEASDSITIITGPGTIYKVMSDEQQENPANHDQPYTLVVQVAGGQLPPMGFADKDGMELAVSGVLVGDVLRHIGRVNHEYTFVHVCPGTVFMKFTTADFLGHQRLRLAEHQQRKEAEAKAAHASTLTARGGIILPGGN